MPLIQRDLYIDGRWRASANGRLPVICPATEKEIGSIPAGSKSDIDHAVNAATKAYYEGPWARSTGAYRAGFLRKIAEKVLSRGLR